MKISGEAMPKLAKHTTKQNGKDNFSIWFACGGPEIRTVVVRRHRDHRIESAFQYSYGFHMFCSIFLYSNASFIYIININTHCMFWFCSLNIWRKKNYINCKYNTKGYTQMGWNLWMKENILWFILIVFLALLFIFISSEKKKRLFLCDVDYDSCSNEWLCMLDTRIQMMLILVAVVGVFVVWNLYLILIRWNLWFVISFAW